MMQKLWQAKPKLNYSKDVLDIVQFGSSVIEGKEPNDIDIAVIYHQIPLKNQLEYSQEIKKQLQKLSKIPIHINSFDFYSFFDKGNFAKDSILFYGKSLVSGKSFSKMFGLYPRLHIKYSLVKLLKKDKVRMNYLLNGKGNKYGLLREYNGRLIAPGLIEVPPEYENVFLNSMKKIAKEISVTKNYVAE